MVWVPEDRYGVTEDGFVLKGIDTIITEQQARARQMFGEDIDLSPGSPIRKLTDAVAWQAHELWKSLERQYYANFVSTADGPSLDLLGDDLGVVRRNLHAGGDAVLTLAGGEPGRRYDLPEGTVMRTAAGVRFRTLEPVALTGPGDERPAGVEAMLAGVDGNIAADQLTELDPEHARFHLDLGGATVTPSNPRPFSGGELLESDPDYRQRLRAFPRTIWTLDRFVRTVLEVPGVRDCLVFDPHGGTDVSQSFFNLFQFGQRAFSLERRLASPYFFDVVVATLPGWPWRTLGGFTGVFERVQEAVREVRPVSVFPNVVQANEVEIGVRARLVIQPGRDTDAIVARILADIRRHVSGLALGRDVLYSDVLLLARLAPGVRDVQDLHLRRCLPVFARVNVGGASFGQEVELAVGENVSLAPDEIPLFTIDSLLVEFEVEEQ